MLATVATAPIALHTRTAMPAQARPRLLLFPGLLSTPREFGMITHAMRLRGVPHRALAIPGYTDADHRRPTVWQDWVNAAARAMDDACGDDRSPVVVGGLCVGGMIAAALALQRPERVAGLVMIAPSWVYDGWGLSPWLRWRHAAYALGIDRWIHIREREPYGIKNAKIRGWVARDMAERAASAAGPASLPLWGIHQCERLTAWNRTRLHALRAPLLTLHPREDEITTLDSVARVLDAHGPADRRLVALADSYHLATMDNDRHRVVDGIVEFMQRFNETDRKESTPWTTPSERCAA